MAGNLLEVRELRTVFHSRERTIHAVNSVSFDLREGEILGIVGESGSGKSVTMMSLLGLLPIPPAEFSWSLLSDPIHLQAAECLGAGRWQIRRRSAVFHSVPNSCFNCRLTGTIVVVSMPRGSLKCRPGGTSLMYLPKRWTTATESLGTV